MNVCPPMPDPNHDPTAMLGAFARIGRSQVNNDEEGRAFWRNVVTPERARFSQYVQNRLQAFAVLPAGLDITVEECLKHCPYTEERKAQILKQWRDDDEEMKEDDGDNEGFVKREWYMLFKFARLINSRTDKFKAYSGRFFRLIESEVYQMKEFIKHVPVTDRPKYIKDMFEGFNVFYGSDYTSYESSFDTEFMLMCECEMYRHYLKNYPVQAEYIISKLTGLNKCKFRGFEVRVRGVRMSGDMCTSLGNGFSNLMIFEYMCMRSGVEHRVVVEGDDALAATSGPIDETIPGRLGFTLKIDKYDRLEDASFCGMLLSSEGTRFSDPRKNLIKFGWSHSALAFGGLKVRLGLLRAKSLSLMYENPRCPILTALANRGLQLTQGYKARWDLDAYKSGMREQILSSRSATCAEVAQGISATIRADFARLFDITPDVQIAIEEELSRLQLGCNYSPLIESLYAAYDDVYTYARLYVHKQTTLERSARVSGINELIVAGTRKGKFLTRCSVPAFGP